mmetsp:Transcript_20711/g.52586  ORF Transcript_20711/g.52586 Transcript_20711/m.52586 type:complete len:238 (-) Transcript_20711:540-1253(-)
MRQASSATRLVSAIISMCDECQSLAVHACRCRSIGSSKPRAAQRPRQNLCGKRPHSSYLCLTKQQPISALVADKLLHAQDLEYCSLDGPSRLADLIADLRETGGLEQVDWGGSTGALSSSSRASGLSRRSPGSVRQQTRRSKMRRSDSIVPSSQRSSRAPHRANHRSSRSRNSTRPLPAFCARLPSRPGCRPPHARRQRARRCRLPSHRRWSSCSPRHPSRAQMSRQIVRCQQGKEQ